MPRHGTNDLLLQFLFWLPCLHMRADCRQIATRDPVVGVLPERLEDPMLAIRHADRPVHYGKLRGATSDVKILQRSCNINVTLVSSGHEPRPFRFKLFEIRPDTAALGCLRPEDGELADTGRIHFHYRRCRCDGCPIDGTDKTVGSLSRHEYLDGAASVHGGTVGSDGTGGRWRRILWWIRGRR